MSLTSADSDYGSLVAPSLSSRILQHTHMRVHAHTHTHTHTHAHRASLTRAKLWWLDNWVRESRKLQVLWGFPGLQWSLSRKEQWWTSHRAMGGQDSLMHVGSEGWPMWSDPTDDALLPKLLKKLMLVLLDRCQNTQCIAVCCVWGCIATDQSGCQCWPLTSVPCEEEPTMGTWASELDHRAMEEGGLVWWMTFSFTSCGWPGVCASLTFGNTWHHDALWEEGKLVEAVWCFGQCSAEKPWVLPSMLMLLWHVPPT